MGTYHRGLAQCQIEVVLTCFAIGSGVLIILSSRQKSSSPNQLVSIYYRNLQYSKSTEGEGKKLLAIRFLDVNLNELHIICTEYQLVQVWMDVRCTVPANMLT